MMDDTGRKSRLHSLKMVRAKWLRRSPAERVFLLEAFILLGAARLCVVLFPMKWLARTLGTHMHDDQTPLTPSCSETALIIGRAVRSAAGWTPWESACLPQAVAAKWLLKRRNIPATVYLGVMKDESKPEKMAAHAWVRCGRFILTGADGHRRFTVVSTFS